MYTPVLALADVDGFYILYNDTDKEGKLTKVKTQKFPYIAEFDEDIKGNPMSYTVNVTLGDEVTVTFASDKNIYNGNYSELAKKYPKTHLANVYEKTVLSRPGSFTDWKNHVISEAICEQLNHYVQRNNTIASDFGIKYNFTLPESASTELANGISDITFIALFQGYPYGAGTKSVYNKFCVSGAHVDKIRAQDEPSYWEQADLQKYVRTSWDKSASAAAAISAVLFIASIFVFLLKLPGLGIIFAVFGILQARHLALIYKTGLATVFTWLNCASLIFGVIQLIGTLSPNIIEFLQKMLLIQR